MEPAKEYYPPMHTAEHILNQMMVSKFGCKRSFNNHIEKKKSKCDYHFERPLTETEILELENKVNEIILKNYPITEEFMNRSEALKYFNLEKLPDQSGDTVRIIKVGDYDACPCIGSHVINTSEIGIFNIISTSFEESVLRIRFKLKE
jgi:misacylated tRNA(Ala) deacylase